MRKKKTIIDYSKFSPLDLIEEARNSVIKMTGNSNFQTPDILLATITAAANALEIKFNAAQGGGTQQNKAMQVVRKALTELMHKQAQYVDRIADSDEVIILSGGFHVSKDTDPVHRPEFTVEYPKTSKEGKTLKKTLDSFIDSTHQSAMVLKRKTVKGAKSWVWQLCPDPMADEKWIYAGFSTQTTITIKGLTPGINYWFRSTYISKDGLGKWCDPIAKRAE